MGTFAEQQKISTYWYNKASDLRRAAKAVYDGGSNVAVFRMLGGMSIEALLKAIIVEKGVEPRRTHNLNRLAMEAGVAYSKDARKLLQILSEAIIWDGRYPVPTEERHWDALNELEKECLFDKTPIGRSARLIVRTPNGNLNWNSFDKLWLVSSGELCRIASWLHREPS